MKRLSTRPNNKRDWEKYGFEFLSIFMAVLAAFALNNWNDNRRDNHAEDKILSEIANGLTKDISDIYVNKDGHLEGIQACGYWRGLLTGNEVSLDSLPRHYQNLTRDYISIQNTSGYETLKSRGLELLRNDSLRLAIISLYEYDYTTLRKLEEEYHEGQFQSNYFEEMNKIIAPMLSFGATGEIETIKLPINISETDRNILFSFFWKIEYNRRFNLQYYSAIEDKIQKVLQQIEKELK